MVATSHPDAAAVPSPQRLGLIAFGTVAGLFALLFTFCSPEPSTVDGGRSLASGAPSVSDWSEAAP